MERPFRVIVGTSAFKITDELGIVIYGAYADRDDADHYAELLNEKWERDLKGEKP